MKLSAHLGFQFNEVSFLDRFELAARCGYRAVEFPSPYGHDLGVLKRLLDEQNLQLVQIGAPMGNSAAGEKGLASFPGRRKEYRDSLDIARDAALSLGCPRIHVMSGVVTEGADANWDVYVENLQTAVEVFGSVGIKTLVEVMSPQEVPGYFMSSFDQAEALFAAIPDRNLEFLFDTYHAAALVDDSLALLERWLPRAGHIQISDFPGRHEPGTGTLPFQQIFAQLASRGYQQYVGCEYRPLNDTLSGLSYLEPYLHPRCD
ncbi:hydroxypyruvate isomerase [Paraburkholderia unamae]|uniref:hydroxypyruvate isomerase family protein n=1 Tax=Paraburkholderia unamae TaxID=219649 RepID=UPI000DC46AC5|nr:TIM barrel protein [Paraburkholderia unamae]RAR55377.1 hydroxypyruvate isomerase [Paraburkholderia unamae]